MKISTAHNDPMCGPALFSISRVVLNILIAARANAYETCAFLNRCVNAGNINGDRVNRVIVRLEFIRIHYGASISSEDTQKAHQVANRSSALDRSFRAAI
jgi:hypothetical protein